MNISIVTLPSIKSAIRLGTQKMATAPIHFGSNQLTKLPEQNQDVFVKSFNPDEKMDYIKSLKSSTISTSPKFKPQQLGLIKETITKHPEQWANIKEITTSIPNSDKYIEDILKFMKNDKTSKKVEAMIPFLKSTEKKGIIGNDYPRITKENNGLKTLMTIADNVGGKKLNEFSKLSQMPIGIDTISSMLNNKSILNNSEKFVKELEAINNTIDKKSILSDISYSKSLNNDNFTISYKAPEKNNKDEIIKHSITYDKNIDKTYDEKTVWHGFNMMYKDVTKKDLVNNTTTIEYYELNDRYGEYEKVDEKTTKE